DEPDDDALLARELFGDLVDPDVVEACGAHEGMARLNRLSRAQESEPHEEVVLDVSRLRGRELLRVPRGDLRRRDGPVREEPVFAAQALDPIGGDVPVLPELEEAL